MIDHDHNTVTAMEKSGDRYAAAFAKAYMNAFDDMRAEMRTDDLWAKYSEIESRTEALKSTGWNPGEPPRDGKTRVIIGRLAWSDGDEGGTQPVLTEAHFENGWLNSDGLALAECHGETLHIDWWIDPPDKKEDAQ